MAMIAIIIQDVKNTNAINANMNKPIILSLSVFDIFIFLF